jgi:hypothetical protein
MKHFPYAEAARQIADPRARDKYAARLRNNGREGHASVKPWRRSQ